MDIQAMEENLLRISETWNAYNSEFEESGEMFYKIFVCLTVSYKTYLYNRQYLKSPEWLIDLKLNIFLNASWISVLIIKTFFVILTSWWSVWVSTSESKQAVLKIPVVYFVESRAMRTCSLLEREFY